MIENTFPRLRFGLLKAAFPRLRFGFSMVIVLAIMVPAFGEDWPQFLGPRRDGTSAETKLITSWTKKGPPLLWRKAVGDGFSGPVVAGKKLIVFHRQNGKEVIECWNADNGDAVWNTSYVCNYRDGLGKGDGPRATPVIAGDRVYTLGVNGRLLCLNLKDGGKIWQNELNKTYNIPGSYFGVGTSPIVMGDKVLVNVGGRAAGIVAFDAKTGKEAWRATTDAASYSSPTAVKINGKQRAVFFTRQGPVIVNPDNGKVIHQQRWRARYAASVNAATPLAIGDLLFFSTSYETGALVLRIKGDKIKEVWKGDEIMSNHYNTCVHHQGYLYGIHGRQEAGPSLRCIDLKTGKVQWTKDRFGCASMILANDKIISLTEQGELALFAPTHNGYKELSRAQILNDTPCRAQIALANGRLYARDGSRLVCLDLRAAK